jgi:hypothetical protein
MQTGECSVCLCVLVHSYSGKMSLLCKEAEANGSFGRSQSVRVVAELRPAGAELRITCRFVQDPKFYAGASSVKPPLTMSATAQIKSKFTQALRSTSRPAFS